MIRKIRLLPIAEESLGVRSMCFYLETPDIKMLLDAGLSLAPRRYGLPPHPIEFKTLKILREEMIKRAERVNAIFISHYHYDHVTPSFNSWFEWSTQEIFNKLYSDKVLFIKDYKNNINFNQKRRGHAFVKEVEKIAKEIVIVDSKKINVGNTELIFSEPVPHGSENGKLGYVLMLYVKYDDESVLFAPDVQGPISDKTLARMLELKPNLLILGGPPTYLSGSKVKNKEVEKGLSSMKVLAMSINTILVCHHLLRDASWKEHLQPAIEIAENLGNKILTPAEFISKHNNLLEAKRKELYERKPPSEEYIRWLNLPKSERIRIPPPID